MSMKMTVALAKRNPLRCSLSCGDPQRDAFPCRRVWSIGSSAHTALASDTYMKSYSLMQAVEIAPKNWHPYISISSL